MSARDDLMNVLSSAAMQAATTGRLQPLEHYADAVIAAGWRPPARVVTTVEEFRAIPDRAVVQTRHVAFEMHDAHRVDAELWMHPDNGPVRVLHEGGA